MIIGYKSGLPCELSGWNTRRSGPPLLRVWSTQSGSASNLDFDAADDDWPEVAESVFGLRLLWVFESDSELDRQRRKSGHGTMRSPSRRAADAVIGALAV